MTVPSITRRFPVRAGLVFWLMGPHCSMAAEAKRVMILHPYSRDTAPFAEVAAAFRLALATDLGEPIDFEEIPLDLTRYHEAGERALAELS